MTKVEMQAAAEAKPFRPFEIRLADGERLPVEHPEYLSHSPDWRTVIVWDDRGNFKIIDSALVTALEVRSQRS
jgi:hypothetical protein